MNKTKQIADKYGVPMPEKCKKIDFKKDTIFVWFVCNKTNIALLHLKKENPNGKDCFIGVHGTFVHTHYDIIPAPQYHELSK